MAPLHFRPSRIGMIRVINGYRVKIIAYGYRIAKVNAMRFEIAFRLITN
jgi:hypothetical protein